ncbi:hypothetical protein [Bacterioplanoides sp.]|uniref:hypothetical protein n=1 Tax=Bacterioplanoides sp. TaxID=2066072 RepID=UPI003B0082C2
MIQRFLIAIFLIMLSNAHAGGAKSGKVIAINTDSRSAHSHNHKHLFVMFSDSTDRYYLDLDGPSGSVNTSMLLMAFSSNQDVYIQWEDVVLSPGFNKKITFVAIGNDWPWPAN